MGEGLSQLVDLWVDDGRAIAVFEAVLVVVVLMVIFCGIKCRSFADLGDYTLIYALLFEFLHELQGFVFLLFAVVKHHRPVLGADIYALTVEGRRVVHGEEDVQEGIEADELRVEVYLHHFGVAGQSAADFTVSGVGDFATHVSAHGFFDPGKAVHDGFDAPEASAAECCELCVVGHSANLIQKTQMLIP